MNCILDDDLPNGTPGSYELGFPSNPKHMKVILQLKIQELEYLSVRFPNITTVKR